MVRNLILTVWFEKFVCLFDEVLLGNLEFGSTNLLFRSSGKILHTFWVRKWGEANTTFGMKQLNFFSNTIEVFIRAISLGSQIIHTYYNAEIAWYKYRKHVIFFHWLRVTLLLVQTVCQKQGARHWEKFFTIFFFSFWVFS